MKRVISLIVALSMLLSIGGTVFAAGQTGYNDVDGTGYETPVSILTALGIMGGYTDGSFHPYSTVTRAEMAAIGVRLRGIKNYGTDVPADEVQYKDMEGHPLAAAVAYARALGIIDGATDGYFYPDDPATYEQAVKMIIGALGYDYYAVSSGGYPSGYLTVARDLKLTSGIGLTVGSYITRGDVAKIVYRALTVDIMEASSYYANDNVTYEVVAGKNILNTYFDVDKVRGVVEENDRTDLYGASSLEAGEVMIDGEIYDDGGTNIGDYLGYYVTFYALNKENSDKRIIISYNVESSKNNYIRINAENIENVSLSGSGYTIDYWRSLSDNKTRQLKISSTPTVIYNGVALTDFTLNDFNPDYGQLTLLDTDNNNVYDLVEVTSYEIMVVLNASSASGAVSANPNFTTGLRSVRLDTSSQNDGEYQVRIMDSNGNRVNFSSINKNTVLHVALSKDSGNTVRTVIVSNNTINGTVQSKTGDGTYIINGTEYEVLDYMVDENALSVGDTGDFYLTYDGRIAGFDGDQKISKNFGLYISCNKGKLSEGGNVIKIMKSDGSFGIYKLAGTVTLNGKKYSGTELFSMISNETSPLFGIREPESTRAGKIIPEPSMAGILYKLNKSGDISEIVMNTKETVPEVTDGEGYSSNEIRCVVQRGKDSGYQYWNTPGTFGSSQKKAGSSANSNEDRGDSLYYSTTYHSFHRSGKQVFVTDNTLLMYSQDSYQKTDDSQVYWVSYPTSLWENYYHEWFEAYFYFTGDKKYADFVVFYDGYDADNSSNSSSRGNTDFRSNNLWDSIRVVDRVIETYDNEGEVGYRLMYWEGGVSNYRDFNMENYYTNCWYRDGASVFWRRGDLIRFILVDGKIAAVGSIFSNYYGGGQNNSWNDPTGAEVTGGKNPDHKYLFPYGFWELQGYYNERQYYYVGRVKEMDTLRYFSTMDIQYGKNSTLLDEPVEGNCYRFVYDSRGYIVGVDNVGNGAISEGQLILIRRQGQNNQVYLRVKESYILYEYEDIQDSQELRNYYKDIYPEFDSASTAAYEYMFDDVADSDVL